MWKKLLLGVVVFVIIVVGLALYFTKDMAEVANMQLEALRVGDIPKAYSYTSEDFQKTTKIADFETFVNTYPFLKENKTVNWKDREVKDNMGSLKGVLIITNEVATPIEYRFIKENNAWKVLGIQLHRAGITPPPIPKTANKDAANNADGEIYQVLVSDTINNLGDVETMKTTIPATSSKIYVSVYILHAKQGLKVKAEMVRVKNGAKLGPGEGVVGKNDNIIRDFSFTNTDSAWPPGDYKINVTTSNNQSSSVDIKIE